jgi:hypothetical protein
MGRLIADKLHVRFAAGTTPDGPVSPRRYTLTHSDATGDLYLTIGADHDLRQLRGVQARFMRDEVRQSGGASRKVRRCTWTAT